jgi:hypothetical protein
MPTQVRFRFNKVTGEIEEFVIDDQDRRLPEAEHDRRAQDVARLVAVNPRIEPIDAPAVRSAISSAQKHDEPLERARLDDRALTGETDA